MCVVGILFILFFGESLNNHWLFKIMFNRKSFNLFVVFLFMAVVLASCSSGPPAVEQDASKSVPKTPGTLQTSYTAEPPAYLLEVADPNSDKIYVFTDSASYRDYLSSGELPSGKEVTEMGQTRVFVGVPEDQPLNTIGAHQLYQGEGQPGADFFVQRLVNGPTPRIYVFSNPDLLNTPVDELPMQQSAVDGPNGELVIYSLQGTDFYSLQQKFLNIMNGY